MAKPPIFYFSVYKSLIKTMFQLMYGIWKINHLTSPIVSIFGGSRLQVTSRFAYQAHDLAALLVRHDISVITGGGPGIMQAANCGAFHAQTKKTQARSIGITVKGLEKEAVNVCAQEKFVVDYFFVRKWLLINYAVAFAIFPGGFGTIDELGDVVTLIQTNQLEKAPIVLIGRDYWGPFMQWLQECALKEGLVAQKDLDLIQITDDIDEAFEILKLHCETCK